MQGNQDQEKSTLCQGNRAFMQQRSTNASLLFMEQLTERKASMAAEKHSVIEKTQIKMQKSKNRLSKDLLKVLEKVEIDRPQLL